MIIASVFLVLLQASPTLSQQQPAFSDWQTACSLPRAAQQEIHAADRRHVRLLMPEPRVLEIFQIGFKITALATARLPWCRFLFHLILIH